MVQMFAGRTSRFRANPAVAEPAHENQKTWSLDQVRERFIL